MFSKPEFRIAFTPADQGQGTPSNRRQEASSEEKEHDMNNENQTQITPRAAGSMVQSTSTSNMQPAKIADSFTVTDTTSHNSDKGHGGLTGNAEGNPVPVAGGGGANIDVGQSHDGRPIAIGEGGGHKPEIDIFQDDGKVDLKSFFVGHNTLVADSVVNAQGGAAHGADQITQRFSTAGMVFSPVAGIVQPLLDAIIKKEIAATEKPVSGNELNEINIMIGNEPGRQKI